MDNSLIFTVKSQARAWAKTVRAGLAGEQLRRASEKIVRRLLAEDWMALPSPLGLYRATAGEIETAGLFAAAKQSGWEVATPRAESDGTYSWREDGEEAVTEQGPHGILQPRAEAGFVAADALRVVIVPGLAFDRHGHRLGHGGGIYDRLLAPAQANALLVGVCCETLVADALPAEPHDVQMDVLATEARLRFMPTAADKLVRLLGDGRLPTL